MRRAARVVAILSAMCLAEAPALARAEVVRGDAAVISSVALGTVGGITSSIAAIVYAVDDRAFPSGWAVVALFSSAITGALTASLIQGVARGEAGGTASILGMFFFGAMTVWPGYWTVKSAWMDPEGEPTPPVEGALEARARDPAGERTLGGRRARVVSLGFEF